MMTVVDVTEKAKSRFRSFIHNMWRRVRDASFGVFVVIGLLFALVGFFAGTGVRTIVLPPKVIVVTPGDEKNVSGTTSPGSPSNSAPTEQQSHPNVPLVPKPVGSGNPPKLPHKPQIPQIPKKPPIIEVPQPEIPPKGPIIKLCLPDLPIIGKVGVNCKE